MVEFNITEQNKTETESEDEQKSCSKSPVPPTPKKKQLLSSCEFSFKFKIKIFTLCPQPTSPTYQKQVFPLINFLLTATLQKPDFLLHKV